MPSRWCSQAPHRPAWRRPSWCCPGARRPLGRHIIIITMISIVSIIIIIIIISMSTLLHCSVSYIVAIIKIIIIINIYHIIAGACTPLLVWRYLSNTATFEWCVLCLVKDHHSLLCCSPRSKNTCVRQVVLDKRFPPSPPSCSATPSACGRCSRCRRGRPDAWASGCWPSSSTPPCCSRRRSAPPPPHRPSGPAPRAARPDRTK